MKSRAADGEAKVKRLKHNVADFLSSGTRCPACCKKKLIGELWQGWITATILFSNAVVMELLKLLQILRLEIKKFKHFHEKRLFMILSKILLRKKKLFYDVFAQISILSDKTDDHPNLSHSTRKPKQTTWKLSYPIKKMF